MRYLDSRTNEFVIETIFHKLPAISLFHNVCDSLVDRPHLLSLEMELYGRTNIGGSLARWFHANTTPSIVEGKSRRRVLWKDVESLHAFHKHRHPKVGAFIDAGT
jgi:hypothetical protein